jgi:predicted transcriptional regulator
MGNTTVRISDATRQILREMAQIEGKPMQAILEEAVEALRRKRFLEEVNAAYASLRVDAKAWASIEGERRAWDATLLEGLSVQEPRGRHEVGAKRRTRRKRT